MSAQTILVVDSLNSEIVLKQNRLFCKARGFSITLQGLREYKCAHFKNKIGWDGAHNGCVKDDARFNQSSLPAGDLSTYICCKSMCRSA